MSDAIQMAAVEGVEGPEEKIARYERAFAAIEACDLEGTDFGDQRARRFTM